VGASGRFHDAGASQRRFLSPSAFATRPAIGKAIASIPSTAWNSRDRFFSTCKIKKCF